MRTAAILAAGAVMFLFPAITTAASTCPPEVREARTLLTAKATNVKPTQPSKSQAGARTQDVEAPRSQDVQAPRGQDVQAPRGQDVPRAKDHPEPPEGPAPRGQDVEAPRNVSKGRAAALANARRLVNDAETACKDADAPRARANAHAARELLNYVP
jgi:hypothetical protein